MESHSSVSIVTRRMRRPCWPPQYDLNLTESGANSVARFIQIASDDSGLSEHVVKRHGFPLASGHPSYPANIRTRLRKRSVSKRPKGVDFGDHF
jgi:hypothetical protein